MDTNPTRFTCACTGTYWKSWAAPIAMPMQTPTTRQVAARVRNVWSIRRMAGLLRSRLTAAGDARSVSGRCRRDDGTFRFRHNAWNGEPGERRGVTALRFNHVG